jgi:hypothetical protein
MRVRTLSIANMTLGLLLGALTFIAPPRFLAAACAGNVDCSVTQLDRLQFGSVPVLAFAVFVGIALLISKLSGIAARLLLATPLVIGLASMLGLFGVAIFASLQA